MKRIVCFMNRKKFVIRRFECEIYYFEQNFFFLKKRRELCFWKHNDRTSAYIWSTTWDYCRHWNCWFSRCKNVNINNVFLSSVIQRAFVSSRFLAINTLVFLHGATKIKSSRFAKTNSHLFRHLVERVDVRSTSQQTFPEYQSEDDPDVRDVPINRLERQQDDIRQLKAGNFSLATDEHNNIEVSR